MHTNTTLLLLITLNCKDISLDLLKIGGTQDFIFSRRAMTSQPGKRSRKSRLTSASLKGVNTKKSEIDVLEENPYNSALNQTTENPLPVDEDQSMININTRDDLNKTNIGNLPLTFS